MAARRRNPFATISDTPIDAKVMRVDAEGELNLQDNGKYRQDAAVEVLTPGTLDYSMFIWPAIVTLSNGTMLCVGQASKPGVTAGNDVVSTSSLDGGLTWGNFQVVWKVTDTIKTVYRPTIVVGTGDVIFVFGTFAINTEANFGFVKSTDRGNSWSSPMLLPNLKLTGENSIYPSSGAGIMMKNGWLVVPIIVMTTGGTYSTIFWSKDNGNTWNRSTNYGLPYDPKYTTGVGKYFSQDCAVVEYPLNTIMMCAKPVTINDWVQTDKSRYVYTTTDLGENWTPHITNRTVRMTPPSPCALFKINSLNNQDRIVLACSNGFTTSAVATEKITLHLLSSNDTEWIPVGVIDDLQCKSGVSLTFNHINNKLFCALDANIDRSTVENANSLIRVFDISRYMGRITASNEHNFRTFHIPASIDNRFTHDATTPFRARYQNDGVWIGGILRLPTATKMPDTALQMMTFPVNLSGPFSVSSLLMCFGTAANSKEMIPYLLSATVDKTTGQMSISSVDNTGRTNLMSTMDTLYFPNQKVGVFG